MFTLSALLATQTTFELGKLPFATRFDLSSEFVLSSIFVDPSTAT
jgi:hypothetical protein